MPASPQQHRGFTLAQADELASALIPRFKDAMKPELDGMRKDLNRIEAALSRHRTPSRVWGAAGGMIAGLLAAITTTGWPRAANPPPVLDQRQAAPVDRSGRVLPEAPPGG